MLEYVLTSPDEEVISHRNEVGYRWSAEELRRIFERAYRKLWLNAPDPTQAPANVELVNVDDAEWAAIKREQVDAMATR